MAMQLFMTSMLINQNYALNKEYLMGTHIIRLLFIEKKSKERFKDKYYHISLSSIVALSPGFVFAASSYKIAAGNIGSWLYYKCDTIVFISHQVGAIKVFKFFAIKVQCVSGKMCFLYLETKDTEFVAYTKHYNI